MAVDSLLALFLESRVLLTRLSWEGNALILLVESRELGAHGLLVIGELLDGTLSLGQRVDQLGAPLVASSPRFRLYDLDG